MIRRRLHSRPELKGRASGFTIIEVMIVLAIAGIILLTMLEAIPSLERSSRNNQRKQDVTAILDAISHYELDNSGNFPACGNIAAIINGVVSNPGSCFSTSNLTGFNLLDYHLSYYTTASQVYVVPQILPVGTLQYIPASGTDIDHVYVYDYEVCSTTSAGQATSLGAGYNNVVALYAIETGSGGHAQECQQL